jgi:hypothetical protein
MYGKYDFTSQFILSKYKSRQLSDKFALDGWVGGVALGGRY